MESIYNENFVHERNRLDEVLSHSIIGKNL